MAPCKGSRSHDCQRVRNAGNDHALIRSSRLKTTSINKWRRPCSTRPGLLFPLRSFSAPHPPLSPRTKDPNMAVLTAHRTDLSSIWIRTAFHRRCNIRFSSRIGRRTSTTRAFSGKMDSGFPSEIEIRLLREGAIMIARTKIAFCIAMVLGAPYAKCGAFSRRRRFQIMCASTPEHSRSCLHVPRNLSSSW